LSDKTRVCVPILEKSYESVVQTAEKSINVGADLLELRFDLIEDPKIPDIKGIINEINFPLIFTNRKKDEGGFFKGSESERIKILMEAAKYADIVDIELSTEEGNLKKILEVAKCAMVSFHDFNKTPSADELIKIVNREKKLGDIAKFAVMPQKMSDTLIVLDVLSRVENTVGISMGNMGKYTRVVAPLFGSPITFASFKDVSAPGQLDIQTTKDVLSKFV
jgi:3-dehydroquinate dehydratase I